MNTQLKKNAKNYFEKDFFKVMNKGVFRKTMENVRKHRDIVLITTGARRIYLVSESNYHITTFFFRSFISNKNEKIINIHK